MLSSILTSGYIYYIDRENISYDMIKMRKILEIKLKSWEVWRSGITTIGLDMMLTLVNWNAHWQSQPWGIKRRDLRFHGGSHSLLICLEFDLSLTRQRHTSWLYHYWKQTPTHHPLPDQLRPSLNYSSRLRKPPCKWTCKWSGTHLAHFVAIVSVKWCYKSVLKTGGFCKDSDRLISWDHKWISKDDFIQLRKGSCLQIHSYVVSDWATRGVFVENEKVNCRSGTFQSHQVNEASDDLPLL